MFYRLCMTSCLIVLLTACAPVAATTTPSLLPPLTSTALPNTPVASAVLATRAVSISPTPEISTRTLTTASPTLIPSITFEPTIVETPQPVPTLNPVSTTSATAMPQPSAGSAMIQIFGPGPLSKVVSPLEIYGYAVPGFDDKGRVDLYGEDGRLLASQLLQLNTAYKWAYFYGTLSFDTSAAGELGRLTMSTQDQYGRINALYSVHLLLLPEGFSIIYPPGDLRERCVIDQPVAGRHLSGGVLTVSGKMLPFNNLPLTVELIGRDGNVANSQLVPISPVGDNYVPFHVDMPYSLTSGKWELLVVSQFDDRVGGLMYLYSQEIYLSP